LHTGEKISGEFVITCGDGTEVFELIEKSFDKVAFAVEREIARSRGFAVSLGRDDRSDSPLGEGGDEWVCVVCLVAKQCVWIGVVDKRFRASKIMSLAWREHQRDGIAQGVDECVNFGGQSTARSADRLRAIFFRAPALC
jgi:hypothetical protein